MSEQPIDALEVARCAKINFENLARGNPAIKAHPFYQIAMEQLGQLIELLEATNG